MIDLFLLFIACVIIGAIGALLGMVFTLAIMEYALRRMGVLR